MGGQTGGQTIAIKLIDNVDTPEPYFLPVFINDARLMPPSETSTAPVVCRLSGEARKMTSRATSSGLAKRPVGIAAAVRSASALS